MNKQTKEHFTDILATLPSSRRDALEKINLPATPAGKEKRLFEIGERISSSEFSPFRGSGKIEKIYFENGFARYMVRLDGGRKKDPLAMFRQKDIAGNEYLAKCYEAGEDLLRSFCGGR